jgi:hypothetical protein
LGRELGYELDTLTSLGEAILLNYSEELFRDICSIDQDFSECTKKYKQEEINLTDKLKDPSYKTLSREEKDLLMDQYSSNMSELNATKKNCLFKADSLFKNLLVNGYFTTDPLDLSNEIDLIIDHCTQNFHTFLQSDSLRIDDNIPSEIVAIKSNKIDRLSAIIRSYATTDQEFAGHLLQAWKSDGRSEELFKVLCSNQILKI